MPLQVHRQAHSKLSRSPPSHSELNNNRIGPAVLLFNGLEQRQAKKRNHSIVLCLLNDNPIWVGSPTLLRALPFYRLNSASRAEPMPSLELEGRPKAAEQDSNQRPCPGE